MNRKIFVGAGVAIIAAGTATAAALSYVTSAGDETRWGVRVARRLGVKSAILSGTGVPRESVYYSSTEAMDIMTRGEFTGVLHLALMTLSDEDRKKALASFNTYRVAANRDPIMDVDLAAFTEEFRQAVLTLLSLKEQSEVLVNFNAHRVSLGLEALPSDIDLTKPVTD